MNGKGTLYYQSNVKAYEGEWLNDEFHGQGSLFNENPQPLDSAFNYHNFDEVDDYWVSYEGICVYMKALSRMMPRKDREY